MQKDRCRPTIIDLFCGCGGFSLGAELAGFHSLAAIDVDPVLQSAFRNNFPGTTAVQADLAQMEADTWKKLIGSAQPDGVIGGPPCQGFSWIGKKRKDDPRNSLIHHFFRTIAILKPRFFVMENVEGLLHPDKIGTLQDAFALIPSNYVVLTPMIVNAADFGAATARRRVVVVGYDPDEMIPLSETDFLPDTSRRRINVRDAIFDLPDPVVESSVPGDFGWASYPTRDTEALSSYAKKLRSAPPFGLGSRLAAERHTLGMVSGMRRTRHSNNIIERYQSIAGGKSDPITKSFRLQWDRQCPTLRAGTGPERGAFQAVRPLHPDEGRVITVREAARLQGFPDWFVFHPTKWHSFRMIGNSVSPLVSTGLLSRVATKLSMALAA